MMRDLFKKAATFWDEWIFTTFKSNPESLGLIRISYALYMLLIIGVPRFGWMGNVPDLLFDSPAISLGGLVSGFPDEWLFRFSGSALAILYVCLLFGFKTRPVSLLIPALQIFNFTFIYSFGKINHDTLFFILIPLVMYFSNWGATYSLDAKRMNDSEKNVAYWPITMLAVLFGFALFTAAVPKLFSGYLNTSYQAVYMHVLRYYHGVGRDMFLIETFAKLDFPFFWELFDWGAVVWELGFLVAIFHRTLFRLFLFIGILFNFLNLLMLNITFACIIPIYMVFINWPLFSAFIKRNGIDAIIEKSMHFKFFLTALALYFLYYQSISAPEPIWLIATKTGLKLSFWVFLIACIVACVDFWFSIRAHQTEQE